MPVAQTKPIPTDENRLDRRCRRSFRRLLLPEFRSRPWQTDLRGSVEVIFIRQSRRLSLNNHRY